VTADPVDVEVRIQAPADLVFSYFTDPAKYVQWMGQSVVIEPRPGGRYAVLMLTGVESVGQFVEVDPPRRLVFTWGSEQKEVPPGATTVEVTFTEDEDATVVRLRHYGLGSAEQRSGHKTGWTAYLARLVDVAEGRVPGRDPASPP
jgi:uncharacterized protein YndB with AHSA1/START domain